VIQESLTSGAVRGTLHRPATSDRGGFVLTHGAGSNSNAPLLVALANAFTAAGYIVLRYDLPFRQQRPKGSPSPAGAARDREGVAQAVQVMRGLTAGPIYAGGQSYGGRQTSMAAAEQPGLARALLLLSYPLHPPGKPAQLRTSFFPNLQVPSLFVHGTRDPFGSPEELQAALPLIPARTELLLVEGAGHDLKKAAGLGADILERLGGL